jgi:hypothetical protein
VRLSPSAGGRFAGVAATTTDVLPAGGWVEARCGAAATVAAPDVATAAAVVPGTGVLPDRADESASAGCDDPVPAVPLELEMLVELPAGDVTTVPFGSTVRPALVPVAFLGFDDDEHPVRSAIPPSATAAITTTPRSIFAASLGRAHMDEPLLGSSSPKAGSPTIRPPCRYVLLLAGSAYLIKGMHSRS